MTVRRQLQTPSRVEIAAGGRSVVVEADEPLSKVEEAALRLFEASDDPRIVRSIGAVGFHADLREEEPCDELVLRRAKGAGRR